MIIAVDIGGTFTDFLGYDSATGRLLSAKTPSTPDDLARGIRHCLEKAGVAERDVETFVHGSTVAINTVIEQKGARTALVVTQGARDVYKIGRGNRPEAYNIWFKRPEPLVPRRLTFEVEERLRANGRELVPFDDTQAREVAQEVERGGAEAVAVCFLHAWANPEHERRMLALLSEECRAGFVTASHEILREYGEYERMSTTVLNAYIGPTVCRYLNNLERMLHEGGFAGELLIMQSNGGVMTSGTAKKLPVAMLESGPVGGFIAAARTGRELGYPNVIAFDMGGTTAKANLILDGEPQMSHGYHIGGYATGQPMMLPVVDTIEVGSGGGSVAYLDGYGSLKVGPRSAGAEPGPACYGRGGLEPTVTDANLLLGRLDPDYFLGGEMKLDVAAARAAMRRIAEPLGESEMRVAEMIVEIAVMKMSLAVRQVSVERGYDPRDFAMVAFGGAGPLHAVEVARSLHIPTVIIPNYPGQFSASGMLAADLRRDFVRTYYRPLDTADFGELREIADDMATEGELRYSLEVRYRGQDFSLAVPLTEFNKDAVHASFNQLHQKKFGYHDAAQPLEIVNIRLTAVVPRVAQALKGYLRDGWVSGSTIRGPALIREYASTTVLFEGDTATVAPTGELIIQVKPWT